MCKAHVCNLHFIYSVVRLSGIYLDRPLSVVAIAGLLRRNLRDQPGRASPEHSLRQIPSRFLLFVCLQEHIHTTPRRGPQTLTVLPGFVTMC